MKQQCVAFDVSTVARCARAAVRGRLLCAEHLETWLACGRRVDPNADPLLTPGTEPILSDAADLEVDAQLSERSAILEFLRKKLCPYNTHRGAMVFAHEVVDLLEDVARGAHLVPAAPAGSDVAASARTRTAQHETEDGK